MAEEKDPHTTLYSVYLSTAEKVSDRRAHANTWMLSVNSALVAFYGILEKETVIVEEPERRLWLWVIPIAGVLVCTAWASLLASYRRLNAAKFEVLQELEKELLFPAFAREQAIYKSKGRIALSKVERWIPWTFAVLYAALAVAAL